MSILRPTAGISIGHTSSVLLCGKPFLAVGLSGIPVLSSDRIVREIRSVFKYFVINTMKTLAHFNPVILLSSQQSGRIQKTAVELNVKEAAGGVAPRRSPIYVCMYAYIFICVL